MLARTRGFERRPIRPNKKVPADHGVDRIHRLIDRKYLPHVSRKLHRKARGVWMDPTWAGSGQTRHADRSGQQTRPGHPALQACGLSAFVRVGRCAAGSGLTRSSPTKIRLRAKPRLRVAASPTMSLPRLGLRPRSPSLSRQRSGRPLLERLTSRHGVATGGPASRGAVLDDPLTAFLGHVEQQLRVELRRHGESARPVRSGDRLYAYLLTL